MPEFARRTAWQRDDGPLAANRVLPGADRRRLTAPVDRLAGALASRGLCHFRYLSPASKTPRASNSQPTLGHRPPAVILNATAFAAGRFDGEAGGNPLADFDCPVLQVIFLQQRCGMGGEQPGPVTPATRR
jgi:hypothetical protein